ncbi:MAG TPA: heavy-metal-associated domain-containing protein [Casimicrobiaceae bacterium]
METITFKVHGMTCGGCAASVTRVLQAIPGVERAAVTLDPGGAEVAFDPARTNLAAFRAAVADAGYDLVE